MYKNRNVAVMGFYGNGNAGDEALLSSVLLGLESFENVESVTVLSSNPSQTEREHGVKAVHNYTPTSAKELATRLLGRNRSKFIKSSLAALKCNTLVIGGGGLFFDKPGDNYHLLKLLKAIFLFETLGKEVFMVGVSIDRFNVSSSAKNLKRILNHNNMKAVISRDSKSTELFQAYSERKGTFYTTEDIAFCLRPDPEIAINSDFLNSYIEKNKNNIGLSLCGYRLRTNDVYRTEVRKAAKNFLLLGYNLVVIPMSVGADNDRQGIMSALAGVEGCESVRYVDEDLTVQQNIRLFSMMDCVIAERLHASILCIVSNTPIIGISYASKVLQMYKSIGREDWQKDSDSIDHEWLLQRVEYSITNRNRVKEELEAIAHEKALGALESFSILGRFLSE